MVSSIRQTECKQISCVLLEANLRSCPLHLLPLLLGLGPAVISSEWLGFLSEPLHTLAALELYPLSPWNYAVAEIFAHIFSLPASARFLDVSSCACVSFGMCLKERVGPGF